MSSSIAFVACDSSPNSLGLVDISDNKMIANPSLGTTYPLATVSARGTDCHPVAPLLLACNGGGFTIYNYLSGASLVSVALPISWGAKFSPDGEYLSVAFDGPPFYRVWKLTYAPDGSSASVADVSGTFPTLTSANNGMNVDWSPDGKYLAVSHWSASNGIMSVIDISTIALVTTGIAIPYAAWSVQFSPDSSMIAVAGNDGMRVYRTDTWAQVFANTANGAANDVAWSPDGTRIVTSTVPATIYSVAGFTITELTTSGSFPTGRAWAVGVSPDSKYAVVGYDSSGHGCAVIDLATYAVVPTAGTNVRGSKHGSQWPVGATVRNIGIPDIPKIQMRISNDDTSPVLDSSGDPAAGRIVLAFSRTPTERFVEHGRGVTGVDGRFHANVNFLPPPATILAVILGADETEGSVAVDWVR